MASLAQIAVGDGPKAMLEVAQTWLRLGSEVAEKGLRSVSEVAQNWQRRGSEVSQKWLRSGTESRADRTEGKGPVLPKILTLGTKHGFLSVPLPFFSLPVEVLRQSTFYQR